MRAQSPPDLSPEVALTQHGMHLALLLGGQPTYLTVRRLAWVALGTHTALNLLTEPAASLSWGARVSEIPGLKLAGQSVECRLTAPILTTGQ